MFLKCITIFVALGHSILVMSSQPAVPAERPVFAGSMFQARVNSKSSQVIGWPSDHFTPSLSVYVTVIASPLSPGTLTPPLTVVGTSVARSGRYLKSFVVATSAAHVDEATLAS